MQASLCVSVLMLFWSLYNSNNRFHVTMGLFSDRLQKTSKCGKNISNTLACGSCATALFLPHLMSSVIYYWTDVRQNGIFLLKWWWRWWLSWFLTIHLIFSETGPEFQRLTPPTSGSQSNFIGVPLNPDPPLFPGCWVITWASALCCLIQ